MHDLHFVYTESYRPSEHLEAVLYRRGCDCWMTHGLGDHQEEASHQEEENVKEEQLPEEDEVGEDACPEAATHRLQSRLP